MENSLVANRFRIDRRIGPNTFRATDTETNEKVAVKFESVNATVPKLHIESNSYKALQHSSRIPDAMHFGVKGENKYLVMTLLGPNLEYLFKQCNRKFSLKTVLMLAFQMVHAIGLGLSKRFRDSTVEHIPFREEGKSLVNLKATCSPLLTSLKSSIAVAFSSDGKMLTCSQNDYKVKIIDCQSGMCLSELERHTNSLGDIGSDEVNLAGVKERGH